MMNVRNKTSAKFVACGSTFVLFFLSENELLVLCFMAMNKQMHLPPKKYPKTFHSVPPTFQKPLAHCEGNINILTTTVKPGQGHHKYHVTFTVHIPLDSYE